MTAYPVTAYVVLTAAVWLGAVPALHAYAVAGAPALLAAAAAGSVAVAVGLTRVLRRPALESYAGQVAALAVLLVATDPHPRAVLAELGHGPGRLLSETLPLDGGPVLLAPLIVTTWLCGAVSAEVLARRPGGLVPAAPLALYLLCYAAASSAPTTDRVAGPVLLCALGLLSVLVRAVASGVGGPRVGLAALAVVVVGTAVMAPLMTDGRRPATVGRSDPVRRPVVADPVDVMAGLREQGSALRLVATTTSPSTGYLGVARLDDYDGAQWRFDASFAPTGGRVPGASPPVAPVTQVLEVPAGLPVPLLPVLDRPVSVAGSAVDADAGSGMLLPLRTAPGTWTVVSRAAPVTLDGLPGADGIAATGRAGPDTGLPPGSAAAVATATRYLGDLAGARPAPTVGFLQAAVTALRRDERRIDSDVGAGGTSLSEVIDAVSARRAATPEQFATFLAVCVRSLGIPARIATGFRVAPSPLPAGRHEVPGRDAWAWVEVPVAGMGWVVADPTPGTTTPEGAPPPEVVQAPATTVPAPAAVAVPRNGPGGSHALAPPAHPRVTARSGRAGEVAVAAAAAAVTTLLPVAAAGRRGWRRRRRRTGTPAAAVVGAWSDVLEALRRAGVRIPTGATNLEVAGEVARQLGPEHFEGVMALAALVDRVLYAPALPADPTDARTAWVHHRAVTRRVTEGLDRRARLRAALTVGPDVARPDRTKGTRRRVYSPAATTSITAY